MALTVPVLRTTICHVPFIRQYHALQLIGLIKSLGIDAKVQFEPKTSAYLSLAEWGGEPPTEPELQSDVLEDGNWITHAKEYDLLFEFSSVEDRDQFDTIIRT